MYSPQTGVWFIQVKLTNISFIRTLFKVSFIQGSVYTGFCFIQGSVYTGFCFIQGSVYTGFCFIQGSVYTGFCFIQGSVYTGFCFIQGVKLSSAVQPSWSEGRTAGHIFGRKPSNDYFIKI